MRLFSLILGSALVLTSCDDESEFPELAPGTYHLEIFNTQGKKLLERDGTAIGLGNYNQVILEDPLFITNDDDDPNFFATLLITTGDVDRTFDQQFVWAMKSDLQAVLNQRYYSIPGDWGYSNKSGSLSILKSTSTVLNGRFTITMKARHPEPYYINWTSNPTWGDEIVVKGYFSSRGW